MLKSWERGYFSAEMQRDVIITDDFVWLSVSNTINSFDKMLGVPKCITPRMSAKQKHQLSSAACAGPHLSVFISRSFISIVFLKSMNALVRKYQDSVGLGGYLFVGSAISCIVLSPLKMSPFNAHNVLNLPTVFGCWVYLLQMQIRRGGVPSLNSSGQRLDLGRNWAWEWPQK